jgi:periplasmic protein TonB
MLPKKTPNADLNKNTRTYFLIGLVVVLLLVWKGVELKTYEKDMNLERMRMLENNEEDIPITEIKFKIPPPPPPQYVPKEIKVIENDEDIKESIIQTTEVDQNTEVPIDNVTILEEFEDSMVPFPIIEDAPIFP